VSNHYLAPKTAARRYRLNLHYVKHRIRHAGGEFKLRGMTFDVNDQGRIALVARDECVCCGDTVTPNRRILYDGRVICVTCRRKAWVDYDQETRDKLGLV